MEEAIKDHEETVYQADRVAIAQEYGELEAVAGTPARDVETAQSAKRTPNKAPDEDANKDIGEDKGEAVGVPFDSILCDFDNESEDVGKKRENMGQESEDMGEESEDMGEVSKDMGEERLSSEEAVGDENEVISGENVICRMFERYKRWLESWEELALKAEAERERKWVRCI
jgi:hypothetical protein